MFQKVAGLVLLFTVSTSLFAQEYTASKTKKLLTANEWELKYVEKGDKKEEPPKSMKGLRLVFMPTKDLIYEYQPGQDEKIRVTKGLIEAEHFKYEDRIEEPEMTLSMDELQEGVLKFSDEFDAENQKYVYTKGRPITDKGYPSGKYEIQDVDVPMQRLSPQIIELVNSINAEVKKCAGNLFFFDKNKDRLLIKEMSFSTTDYGIKFRMVFDTKDAKNRVYSNEFLPEQIDDITEVKVDPESRVGQLKMTLENETCYYESNGNPITLIKNVHIDYLKESANSFNNLKDKLEDLSLYYLMGRVHRLDFLKPYLDKGRKIWLSLDGASSNYELTAADVVGNKIYLHYNLESVSLTSTQKGSYLTIIPLKDIAAMTVEQTKSNPKTLIMHNKKKGFETYVYKDKKYVAGTRVTSMPLFNYGEISWKQSRIESTLRQLIVDDGGDKIKLVYNP